MSRLRNFYGPTLEVLERNGLILKPKPGRYFIATETGRKALLEARREGW